MSLFKKVTILKVLPKIKKHNSITDAKTTYSLPAEKLLNAIYHTWQRDGNRKFTVTVKELKDLIGYKSDGNNVYFESILNELATVQEFRDFEFKGRKIEYTALQFLIPTIYKDKINEVEIEINEKVAAFLKQRNEYTLLELKYTQKFKTLYGLKIYQMFKRYQTMINKKPDIQIVKSLDELNDMFVTNFKSISEIERGIKRGITEIKKITGEDVYITKMKKEKSISFTWEYPLDLKIKNILTDHFVGTNERIDNQSVIKISLKESKYTALLDNNKTFQFTDDYIEIITHKIKTKEEAQ